jgi:hypothetical protein
VPAWTWQNGVHAARALRQAAAALEPRARKTPALFLGHGSPMNAVLDNPYFNDAATMGSISMRSLIIG